MRLRSAPLLAALAAALLALPACGTAEDRADSPGPAARARGAPAPPAAAGAVEGVAAPARPVDASTWGEPAPFEGMTFGIAYAAEHESEARAVADRLEGAGAGVELVATRIHPDHAGKCYVRDGLEDLGEAISLRVADILRFEVRVGPKALFQGSGSSVVAVLVIGESTPAIPKGSPPTEEVQFAISPAD